MTTPLRLPILILACVASIAYPLHAQISVIGDLSQDRDAQAGSSYEGAVTLKNDGNEPTEVKVYQTDYLFSYQGTTTYGDPGSLPRSNARWIQFSPSSAVIPAQGTIQLAYTVSVPPDAANQQHVGTYWSMLMVEGVAAGSPESRLPSKKPREELGIRQTLRYGIQIATHIAHTGTKSVKFLQTKLVPGQAGGKQLQIDIEDTGTLGFRPDVYVELFDAKGESKGKFPGARYRMYPGTSVRQSIDLGNFTPGSYKALVVVDAGGDDVFGAQYSLDF